MVKSKNVYFIPIKKKDRKLVISDPRAHNGSFKEAIDFAIPKGTEILSASDGIVVLAKDESRYGGNNRRYLKLKYLNSIIIRHRNNEFSEYSHLKYKGALVKKGQKVKAGEVIGYSGNTGYTTEPHLHFHVCTKGTRYNIGKTLEVKFNEKLKVRRNFD